MKSVPIWLIFVASVVLILLMLEIGYRLGCAPHRRSPKEKETPVGAFAGAMLGLVAFMLGFTFSLTADRYSARKQNVRNEVMAIETAFLRAKFLPEAQRHEARALFVAYVDHIAEPIRADASNTVDLRDTLTSNRWHDRLWAMVDSNLDSDLGGLYVQSLNKVFELRIERAMLEMAERVKVPIWVTLYLLTCLSVMSVSYQAGIAGSKRSKVGLLLTGCFALVMTLIADLDRVGGIMRVSHTPFVELHKALVQKSST
jgi:hypothetical protein